MKSLVILAIFIVSEAAFGFIENRHLFPIGDSEMMMANTGIALKASSGNAFFNPAGLAQLKQRRLSLSGNTYMKHTSDFSPFEEVEGRDVNLTTSGTQAVPSSVISTLPWKDFTLALGVFVPEQVRSSEISNLDTPNYDVQFSRTTDQQLLLLGLAGGGTFAQIDAGAGCFLGMFTSAQSQTLVAVPKPTSGITDPGFTTVYVNQTSRLLFCQAGIQKDLSESSRVGAVVRLPSMSLEGNADIYGFSKPANGGTPVGTGILKKSSKYEIPGELAMGITHRLGQKSLFLADLSYQLGGKFSPIDGGGTSEYSGTFRWNLGGEYLLSDRHVLRGGYASSPGTAVLKSAGDAKEDYTILTAGYEYREAQSTLGIGIFSASSSGSRYVNANRRGSLTTRATAILLTTGFIF